MSKHELFISKKEFIEDCITKKCPIYKIIKDIPCRAATFKKYYPEYKGNNNLFRHNNLKLKKVKILIPGTCQTCGTAHDGSIGNGRYCSRVCSNKRSDKSLIKRSQTTSRTLRSREKHCWNHGIDSREDRICPICQNIHKQYKSSKQRYCSKLCCIADKKCEFKKKSPGGYRENSGRGKCGKYKGMYFQSTWELAFLVHCIDNSITVTRNTTKFNYIFEGKVKKYIPDFIIDNKYIEVKGYNTPEVEAKILHFPHSLELIDSEKIKPYIKYVIEKYGADFYNILKDK